METNWKSVCYIEIFSGPIFRHTSYSISPFQKKLIYSKIPFQEVFYPTSAAVVTNGT